MKRKYIAFLVLTILTFMFVGKGEMNAQCIVGCEADEQLPTFEFDYPMFTHDPITDNYCTVNVIGTMKKFNCPPPAAPYYEYEVTKVEVYGFCTLTDTEIMKTAVKGIVAMKNKYNTSPNYLKMPKCFEKSLTLPYYYIPCGSETCCIYFESHWDSTVADYYLDYIAFSSVSPFHCPSGGGCFDYCNTNIFPETGRLDISTQMPPPCFSSCTKTKTWPEPYIEYTYPDDDTYINALYTLGISGSNPCFSFNFFQVKYAYLDPEEALEKLTRIALRDIWVTHGNPQYITLNLRQCWAQRYYPQQIYFPCEVSDCCEIVFEIFNNGTEAEVVSNSTPGTCEGICFDVCSIFPSGRFSIPKLSIDTDDFELNNDIKIMPNPNTGIFNLEFNSANDEQHSLQVLDLLGQIVYSSDIMTNAGINNLNLDLSSLPIGVYYLQIVNKGLVVSKIKFIKN
ncbi:MAG: T9SS type A sorting domain-containing protein [Candidatus Kapabacteria bacterium]|nr:T9SS type A sorting domain-containing protein [Candidatus Kapabacteria bacterium]